MDRRLINIKELSEYTGLSINTLYSWVSREKIPCVKVGRLRKFDIRVIDRWIEDNSVPIRSLKERDFG